MKKAFTLMEQFIIMAIIGSMTVVIISTMRPSDVQKETLKKAGMSTFINIEFATKGLLAKNTNNYTLEKMVDSSGEFSIANSGSLSRMVALYKRNLVGVRNSTINSTYNSTTLTGDSGAISGLSASNYSGFKLKNGAYFGLRLYGNCTSTISYIYDPSTPTTRSKSNLCGTIFFDVNSEKQPNVLGVDQYIVGINRRGVK